MSGWDPELLFVREANRLTEMIRKKCGKSVRLAYQAGGQANYFFTINVDKTNAECVKSVVLENLDSAHWLVQPALLVLAQTLGDEAQGIA